MKESSTTHQDIFDVRKIRRLVEMMKDHELCEIDLQQGEVRIQLRRPMPTVQAVQAVPMPIQTAVAPAAPAPAAEEKATPKPSAGKTINSPMVGTFYAAPDPESPPFVKVGDHVGPETVVCIVEAMKVFNQIPAETSGRIVEMLVENGASVEFGQPLFKIDAG